jgi:hypothetical protein
LAWRSKTPLSINDLPGLIAWHEGRRLPWSENAISSDLLRDSFILRRAPDVEMVG